MAYMMHIGTAASPTYHPSRPRSVMSSRPPFTTKTPWEALGIESGEESEEEVLTDAPPSQPERYDATSPDSEICAQVTLFSASESTAKAAPSKSALKKQKALARVEKRQLEKAARAAARAQRVSGGDAQPAELLPTVTAKEATSQGEEKPTAADVLEEVIDTPKPEPIAPNPANGNAHSLPKANGSTPPVPPSEHAIATPAPAVPPVPHAYTIPAPVPADAKPPLQASVPPTPASSEKEHVARRNDIENPPVKPPQPGDSKKKSSFVTRTLWTFIMIGGFICEYDIALARHLILSWPC